MLSDALTICRICGYTEDDFLPWGNNGKEPSFELCPCCNVEFGYEDSQKIGILRYRENWLKSSKFNSDKKYKGQLKNIPLNYLY